MTDELDRDGIIAQLQDENERLRIRLLSSLPASSSFDLETVRSWLFENYLILAAVCLIVSCLASVLESLRGGRHG